MRRTLRSSLLAAVLAVLLPVTAWASTAETWDFNRVNYYRTHHSRHALKQRYALNHRAARWVQWMINHDTLRDDTYGAHCWNIGGTVYGSNVGYGRNAKVIEYALEASAPHRANLLDRHFRWVGIAVATGHGRTWLVQEFCG